MSKESLDAVKAKPIYVQLKAKFKVAAFLKIIKEVHRTEPAVRSSACQRHYSLCRFCLSLFKQITACVDYACYGLFAILAWCTYYEPPVYQGVSPHPVRAYALAPSTDASQCTLLQQQEISHLSCSRVTRVRPRSPAARAFRRAAARSGFASTVVVPCIRPGTMRGLGCGVNAANILPGCAPGQYRCWRWWPRRGFLAFRTWRSDCLCGSASALVTSGWRWEGCCLARRVDALGRRCRLVRALALVSPLRVVEIQGREVELFESFEFHRRVLRIGVQLRLLVEYHCKLERHSDHQVWFFWQHRRDFHA